jgi:hypothetical protein
MKTESEILALIDSLYELFDGYESKDDDDIKKGVIGDHVYIGVKALEWVLEEAGQCTCKKCIRKPFEKKDYSAEAFIKEIESEAEKLATPKSEWNGRSKRISF